MGKIDNFSFEYSLSKDDYLNYFLYNTNHSSTIIKNRKKSKIIISILYLVLLTFIFMNFNDNVFFIINFIIFLFLFFLYIFLEKRKYIIHYKKYITEKLNSRIGTKLFAEFQSEKLLGKENESESLISYKDFSEIIEIENYIFVKIFSTEVLILPKNINVFGKIKSNLKIISKEYHIPYNEELNWKFK